MMKEATFKRGGKAVPLDPKTAAAQAAVALAGGPVPMPAGGGDGMNLRLKHDPENWACNMTWSIEDDEGETLYRGPEWAAKGRMETPWAEWPENARFMAEAEAFGSILATIAGAA